MRTCIISTLVIGLVLAITPPTFAETKGTAKTTQTTPKATPASSRTYEWCQSDIRANKGGGNRGGAAQEARIRKCMSGSATY